MSATLIGATIRRPRGSGRFALAPSSMRWTGLSGEMAGAVPALLASIGALLVAGLIGISFFFRPGPPCVEFFSMPCRHRRWRWRAVPGRTLPSSLSGPFCSTSRAKSRAIRAALYGSRCWHSSGSARDFPSRNRFSFRMGCVRHVGHLGCGDQARGMEVRAGITRIRDRRARPRRFLDREFRRRACDPDPHRAWNARRGCKKRLRNGILLGTAQPFGGSLFGSSAPLPL